MGVGNGRPERSKRKEDFPAVNTHSVCACVCVCGLQILSFNVVQFLWTDWTAECGSGPENSSLPLQNSVQVPVFLPSFSGNCFCIAIDLLEKGADKKKDRHTNITQIWSDSDARCDQVLVSQKTDTSRKTPQKWSPKRAADLS